MNARTVTDFTAAHRAALFEDEASFTDNGLVMSEADVWMAVCAVEIPAGVAVEDFT